MNGRAVSLLVVVVALTCYHLAQRSMPSGLRAAPLFTFVYSAAAVVMLGVVSSGRSLADVREVASGARHWAPWLLAASVAGIEIGVYAMYRTGWGIGTASTSSQAIVAAILVVIGVVRFGEHLTVVHGVGLVLCVAGAGLVAR